MDSTKFVNIKSGFYSSLYLVGNLQVPNIFRSKGECCHAAIRYSTCVYHLWEPFSVLDLIGSEFCFILCVMKCLYSEGFYGSLFPTISYEVTLA
jgi:hypothetical protein